MDKENALNIYSAILLSHKIEILLYAVAWMNLELYAE
jgi:hypothetical protein